MEMFYREFDASSPVATGMKWLAALGARIAVTFLNALAYTDIKKRLQLTAGHIWVLALILAAWCGVSLFPATAGLADVINGILFAIGAIALFEEIKEIGQAGAKAWMLAFEAKTEADLDEAGKALAPALSGTVVSLLELLVTHTAFIAAEAAVLRRFPVPSWFEARFRKAAEPKDAGSQSKAKGKAPEPTEEKQNQSPDDPNPRRMPVPDKARGPREPQPSRLSRTVEGAVRLEGARKTAEVASDSLTPVLVLGGLAAVGVTAAVWALSSAGRRRE
jgi:hypothetical protein